MAQPRIANDGPAPSPHAGYRWLAEHYDALFAPFQIPMNRARNKLLAPILSRVHTACDLGSGTGTAALRLAASGIKMYAVDLSPDMCRLARRKVRQAHAAVEVIQADMRSFHLPESVDLVMCEGDALNHIPHKSDLERVARAVFRTLRAGGHFFFDVNNRLGFLKYWTGTLWSERPGVVMVMRNAHTPRGERASTRVDWFLRERGVWRRHREVVKEVCWSAEETQQVMRRAGFDRVEAWDAAPFFGGNSVVTPGCRTIYLAHRPE